MGTVMQMVGREVSHSHLGLGPVVMSLQPPSDSLHCLFILEESENKMSSPLMKSSYPAEE